MRTDLIVVDPPRLTFYPSIVQAQEQSFGSDAAVKGLGKRIVRRLAWAAEVELSCSLQSLEDVELHLRGGKDAIRIDRTLTIVGLDDEQKARLADIAKRTPVTLMLKAGLPIETTIA